MARCRQTDHDSWYATAAMKGPALLITPFIGAREDLGNLDGVARFAAELGYAAIQLPTTAPSILDINRAAEDDDYCIEVRATLDRHGLGLAGIVAARPGHLLATPPGAEVFMAALAPPELPADRGAWRAWAESRLLKVAAVCERLGAGHFVTFGGGFLWPAVYPFPPLAPETIDAGFAELASRWLPILSCFERHGTDLCFELHPGGDLHDGATFERFLNALGGRARCGLNYDPSHLSLQGMDPVGFVDLYAPWIRGFHVKDAEVRASARSGLWGGYQDWRTRPGRFRSPGTGQIDFAEVFARLNACGFDGWPVLEWECAVSNRFDCAAMGSAFISRHCASGRDVLFDAAAADLFDQSRLSSLFG
jgi:sugar phosphate isomerase/epimerase